MIRSILFSLLLLLAAVASHASPEAQLPMKLDYAEGVIFKSNSASRIEASDNDKAKTSLKLARDKYQQARAAQQDGDFELSTELVNEALKLITSASQMVPNTTDQAEKDKRRYSELLSQVETYTSWHQTSSHVTQQSDEELEAFKEQTKIAGELADKGDYAKANELLGNLLGSVVMKTNSSLKNKTFTYDINFETAIDEYKHELDRNEEYLRLIPVAIAQKQPSSGIKSLMDKFVEKAQILRHDAETQYEEKQFESAVKSMQMSTSELIRALQISGVR